MESRKFKKVGLVFNQNEAWNKYKFENLKIDINYFKKKKYTKFSYVNPNYSKNFKLVSDISFLKKLEIYGKKNGFIFDFAKDHIASFDCYIFFSLENINDSQKNILYTNKKKFLYLAEPPNVDKNIYNKKYHKYFDKIFLNDLNFVDNIKYFYSNGNHVLLKENKIIHKNKKLFLYCMFAFNKNFSGKTSLYEKRYRIINWFDKNYPETFHLYGKGWDLLYEKNILQKLANKVILMLNNFLTYKIEFKRKVYKGFCKNKVETASCYKFEFCIENSSNNGRLSDRIISTFFSGTVPIYLGSVMIEKIIPKNCYISLDQFTTLEKLHNYLSNMSIQKYDNYLKNIEKFINSKRWLSLTADYNVISLIKNIKN